MIVLPFLGIFIYLIAEGKGMGERSMRRAQEPSRPDGLVCPLRLPARVAAPPSRSRRRKQLLDSGAIDQAEFAQLKAKALA